MVQRDVVGRHAPAGFGRIGDLLVANHQDPLRHPGESGHEILNPLDHDHAGGAAEQGRLDVHVNVRVVPVQTGRLILGDENVIGEGLA